MCIIFGMEIFQKAQGRIDIANAKLGVKRNTYMDEETHYPVVTPQSCKKREAHADACFTSRKLG